MRSLFAVCLAAVLVIQVLGDDSDESFTTSAEGDEIQASDVTLTDSLATTPQNKPSETRGLLSELLSLFTSGTETNKPAPSKKKPFFDTSINGIFTSLFMEVGRFLNDVDEFFDDDANDVPEYFQEETIWIEVIPIIDNPDVKCKRGTSEESNCDASCKKKYPKHGKGFICSTKSCFCRVSNQSDSKNTQPVIYK